MPDVKPSSGTCRWCAKPIYHDKGKKRGQVADGRSWHTPCYHEFLLYSDAAAQARFLADRDGPWCAICGPKVGHYTGHLIWMDPHAETGQCAVTWSIRTEVDHVFPLWRADEIRPADRRRLYGPENLWLLCCEGPDSCHKKKTRAEAAERATRRRLRESGGALAAAPHPDLFAADGEDDERIA